MGNQEQESEEEELMGVTMRRKRRRWWWKAESDSLEQRNGQAHHPSFRPVLVVSFPLIGKYPSPPFCSEGRGIGDIAGCLALNSPFTRENTQRLSWISSSSSSCYHLNNFLF